MNTRNTTFTVLSGMGMLLIILGHLNSGILTFWGLFPYYSYHVMIFVFIAGYFYKPENEEKILSYILRKCKTLLLPYFIWNIVYGITAGFLHKRGFIIGEDISLWNIFIEPFVGGHQFMYNAPAWFVPALFLLEVCNVTGRKILKAVKIKNEIVLFVIYLLIGVFTVYMAKRGSVYNYYKIPGRIMLMAPCLQMGRLYRDKGEKLDIVPSPIYFGLLLLMNFIITKTHGGLAYGVVWVTGFANTVFTPFITAMTGIALWLRVARIIGSRIEKHRDSIISKILNYMGTHTYSLMLHHLIVLLGINTIFYYFYKIGAKFVADFDTGLYFSDVYYTYVPMGMDAFKILYAFVIIAVILLLNRGMEKIFRRKQ